MIKDKIIKEYEKSAGYRVCYWCNKAIERGQRILLVREKMNPFRTNTIGAICSRCFANYSAKMIEEEYD